MVSVLCRVQLKGRERAMDLMLTLGFNETIDQLVIVNSVR